MASLVYTKALHALAKGDLDFDTATIKVMLVTSSYAADKDHDFRDDVTNEVGASGTYSAGGSTVTCSVAAIDATNDDVEITLGGSSWTSATITARGAVYYMSVGSAATDVLIAYNDFGSNVTSTAGTFTLNSSILKLQA